MILYLHGFASCGDSTKTKVLKQFFGSEEVMAPNLPANPSEAISLARKLIIDNDIDLIIGSSLGGYYASYLCETMGVKAVLINPSTQPFITLASYVGTNHYWCSGEAFEFTKKDLSDLFEIAISKPSNPSQYLVLLQTGDELLDYIKAQIKYEDATLVIQEGGNHRFENLDEYLEQIKGFRDYGTKY